MIAAGRFVLPFMLAALESVLPGKVIKVDWTFRFSSRLFMVKVKGTECPTDVVVTANGDVLARTAVVGRTNLDDVELDQQLTDLFSSFARDKNAIRSLGPLQLCRGAGAASGSTTTGGGGGGGGAGGGA